MSGGRAALRPLVRRSASAALFVFGMSLTPAALADETDSATRNAARELGSSGVEAYQAGRYEQASDELEKAYSILRVPSLGLWSARALVKRGRLVEAAARYEETLSLPLPSGDAAVHKKSVEEAKTELAALKPAIPTLTVRLQGAAPSEVQVSLDGEPLPQALLGTAKPVNPGSHQVVGLRGEQRVTASETVSEGQVREVALSFRTAAAVAPGVSSSGPDPSDPPRDVQPTTRPARTRRVWSVVALAAGGAGLAFGGVTGLLALNKRGELDETGKCTDGCPSALESDVNELNRYRTLSTVGFIAGGVLVGAGIVLWVTAPSEQQQARARLTPGGVLLEGTF
jgi:hypothetical protein